MEQQAEARTEGLDGQSLPVGEGLCCPAKSMAAAAALTIEEQLEGNRELVASLPGLSLAGKLALYMALYERHS